MWPGLVALCKGAGIDPIALPAEIRGVALAQAGQLLRESLVGFAEFARTRADFASEFGISSGARRRDATGAFARIAAVEQVLEMMLSGRGTGEARAVDEIRAQFTRARQHEVAMAAALREALSAVFEKLNPEALEEQLGRRAQGVAGAELQARLWNRYLERFRATVQSGDAGARRLPGRVRACLRDDRRRRLGPRSRRQGLNNTGDGHLFLRSFGKR